MKVIGDVIPTFNDRGQMTENVGYLGGCIVMLSNREMHIVRLLQEASKGHNYHFKFPVEHSKPNNIEMDNLFWLVLQFAEVKFAVNEFKSAIDKLDDILMKSEDISNEA